MSVTLSTDPTPEELRLFLGAQRHPSAAVEAKLGLTRRALFEAGRAVERQQHEAA